MPFFKRLHWLAILLCVLLFPFAAVAQSVPQIDPVGSYDGDNAVVSTYFARLQQGRVGLLGVEGTSIESVVFDLFGMQISTFEDDGAFYAFASVPLSQAIREYVATAQVTYTAGTEESILFPIQVTSGEFIQQPVSLPFIDESVLDPEIEQNELDAIFAVASTITPEALWDDAGFIIPTEREFTSPFGAVRVFNDTLETLHTGWDYTAFTGEIVPALASGRVAFAGALPIRGNYVIIDHGWGLYTGYAHMSVVFVTQGQTLRAGQFIGRVGSTGRSSSAHAHIEMIANGGWVDVADFLQLYVPPSVESDD